MRDGAIEQVGSPLELYDHPANQFVAQFIGTPSMNIVPAKALATSAMVSGKNVPPDGFLGIRPEGVRLIPQGNGTIQGRVELIEALGSDSLIYVAALGVSLVSRQSERTNLVAGDAVAVEFNPRLLHVFNSDGNMAAAA